MMYITQRLLAEMEKIKKKFVGELTYEEIDGILSPLLRKFRCKIEYYRTKMVKNDFFVGGAYDIGTVRFPVKLQITLPEKYNSLKLNRKRWRQFLYCVFAIVHHEHIHLVEDSHRSDKSLMAYMSLDDNDKMTDKQIYLADIDEILAYSHDIALDIKFYNPKHDPFEVLGRLDEFCIESYEYYKETFDGTKWSTIRKRLLKNVYLWIVYNNDHGDWFYLK